MPNRLSWFVAALLTWGTFAFGQPRTRAEVIEDERDEKTVKLWPERQSPLVDQVNALVERGLREGAESGKGGNGPQIVLGGMRSGQGTSFGVGYRRSDLWRERIGYRATVRGTPRLAYMVDLDVDFQSLGTRSSFVNLYTKYEHSPRMDYYGGGRDSLEANRTSYLLDDFSSDLNFGFEPFRNFRAGLTTGWVSVHTGSGNRGGVPSIEEIFTPETTPGLGEDTSFLRWGGFFAFDYRDSRSGPKSGGYYGVRYRVFKDLDLRKFGFRQTELELQQYFPYFNGTRVIALRVASTLSFAKTDQVIPYYLQPTLGGNDDLRGFQRYRFYDDNFVFASIEHRWHAFTALDMAIFVDAGKVVHQKADVDFTDLDYSAGLGFRFRLLDAVVSRIDFAWSREGFRFMWTFSDIYRSRY